MRIPSAEETAHYFLQYGLHISPADLRSSRGWKVAAPNLPLDERTFPSLGALWLEWMDYAAERLSIESKVKRFVVRFESSSPEERKNLLSALANYPDTSTGSLKEMFEDLPHLPRTTSLKLGRAILIRSGTTEGPASALSQGQKPHWIDC